MTDPSNEVDGPPDTNHLRNIITEQVRASFVAMLPVYLPPILTNAIKEQFRSIAGVETILEKHSTAMAQGSAEIRSSFIASRTLYQRELAEITETHLKRFSDRIEEMTNTNLVIHQNKISAMNGRALLAYFQLENPGDVRLTRMERELRSLRRVNYGLLLIGGGLGAIYLWKNREIWNSKGWTDTLSRNGSHVWNKVNSWVKYLLDRQCFVPRFIFINVHRTP